MHIHPTTTGKMPYHRQNALTSTFGADPQSPTMAYPTGGGGGGGGWKPTHRQNLMNAPTHPPTPRRVSVGAGGGGGARNSPTANPRLESCGVLVTRASTRQHKKILISGTIGAFRSGKRVADMAVLSPGTVMKSSGQRPPTENTVSGDTVLFPLHRLHIEMHMACTADFNPVPVQRYLQPPSNSYIRIA